MDPFDLTDLNKTTDAPAPPATPKTPIELLENEDRHKAVLEYLLKRINYSEQEMSKFHDRWRMNESKMQAYIDVNDYKTMTETMKKDKKAPQITDIVVPYSYATVWTVVTYLVHTFCGRKPMFQVGTHKAETAKSAKYMETILQYNADHNRLVKRLFQYFLDGEIYGVAVMRTLWKEEWNNRTAWTTESPAGLVMPNMAAQKVRKREKRKTYEGNDVLNVDPFLFFPDPRVPMAEVSSRGEFVFWRSFDGIHTLKIAENNGQLKYVDKAGNMPQGANSSGSSVRNLSTGGEAHPGMHQGSQAMPYIQVDQGSVVIIPKELGLSDSTEPEKWLFTILNKKQIVQAEPLDLDHGKHPISVSEPYSFGYGFGQVGLVDMLGVIQDAMSWLVNSHIHNVRSVLNNMVIVDPSMVEMQDLQNPKPGKIIRLKRSAYGQDVRTVLQQMDVRDVTGSHIKDMQTFMSMADALSATNDNLRGIQDSGGRKTATEVRTSGEAGSSRLAAHARLISAQGITDLTEQMSLNTQQNLTMEFYLQVVGAKGMEAPVPITPEMVAGDFYYPIHDGTLPLDRVALIEVWKEIWLAISQSPQLSGQYNAMAIFEYMAELGGAQNLPSFKVVADETVQSQAGAGNLAPAPSAPPPLIPGA